MDALWATSHPVQGSCCGPLGLFCTRPLRGPELTGLAGRGRAAATGRGHRQRAREVGTGPGEGRPAHALGDLRGGGLLRAQEQVSCLGEDGPAEGLWEMPGTGVEGQPVKGALR